MTLKEIVQDPETKFVDVRTEQEFNIAHLQNAINIPLHDIAENTDKIKGFNAPAIVLYCLSGNRSGQALNYLKQQGFENVYNGGSMEDINYLLN